MEPSGDFSCYQNSSGSIYYRSGWISRVVLLQNLLGIKAPKNVGRYMQVGAHGYASLQVDENYLFGCGVTRK